MIFTGKEKSVRSKKRRREEIRRKFLVDINFSDRRRIERRKCWRRAVKVSTVVDKNIDFVYDFVSHIENFPQFIEGIKSIKVIEKKNNRKVVDWKIDVEGVPVQWREENIFNKRDKTIKFKMLKGDYEIYEGEWKFLPAPEGTQVFISVN
ncbi:SRPBCC family protein, partial [bacterium]|nr:SRPBCC family protein [bacterium]